MIRCGQRADAHHHPDHDQPDDQRPGQDGLVGLAGPAAHQPLGRLAVAQPDGLEDLGGEVDPQGLVAIGMMSAEEARELHAMETSGAASSGG
jgi:hypothetical protein